MRSRYGIQEVVVSNFDGMMRMDWEDFVDRYLAEELEDPFGTENNDLPLDAICNAIEIDLLQMNDETEIPAKILPDRHYQLT